jgi:hypothetical protein
MQLYLAGEHDQLSTEFLDVLRFYSDTFYVLPDPVALAALVRFLKTFLTLFTQPDYVIAEPFVPRFLRHNYLISNLVAMTPLRNTDAFLELLRHEPRNLIKILTLYSARNTVHFDRGRLFEAHPQAASQWYNCFCNGYLTAFVRDEVARHFAEHLAHHDPRMTLVLEMQEPYYGSTYLDGAIDREVKPFLNQVVRRSIPQLRCANHPDPRKIAVFSDMWFPGHSVYRNYSAYVRELRKDFHLTFFSIHRAVEELDAGLFDEAHRLEWQNNVLRIDRLQNNNFMVAYFPDIGMTLGSIMLANHRIAPIQVCSPGHSVSTYGADIDYFLSGADVETPDAPERHYSERLVLLPGMGVIHNRPAYRPTGRTKATAEIVCNCPWYAQKVNARFCRTLRRLLEQSRRPVRLRMFMGLGGKLNTFLPFFHDLRQALGSAGAVELVRSVPYDEYMGMMEEGDLALDSFHFGGCNTIADNLVLGKPTLVWEGDKWYNRIGPAMLRAAGLDWLVCGSEEEYLAKAFTLIHDDGRREELAAQTRAADLDGTVFSTAHAPAFARAVHHLIAHHDELRRGGLRQAVVIA